MKLFLLFALLAFAHARANDAQDFFMARITYYTDTQTAIGKRPVQGHTVAAEKAFRFGTKFHIPDLKKKVGGSGVFIKHDVGPAVEKRTASRGKLPVIDVFVSSKAQVIKLGGQKDNVFKVFLVK